MKVIIKSTQNYNPRTTSKISKLKVKRGKCKEGEATFIHITPLVRGQYNFPIDGMKTKLEKRKHKKKILIIYIHKYYRFIYIYIFINIHISSCAPRL